MTAAPRASLLSPAEVEGARARAERILEGLDRTLLGQERLTRLVLVSCLARGHVLLEGVPGLGKTELVKALAALLGVEFRRLQFTPDLLPGDITGGHILEEQGSGRRALVFHPGPVFANVLLADEINRASPKTQSALLEAMQEGRVTVLGETRELPRPFFVLATQNPIELEGTYPLPEAQLDRFLFKLEVEGVGRATLERILNERRAGRPPELESVAGPEELARLFTAVDAIYLPRAVAAFIARLVEATHPRSSLASERVRTYVRHGASPRAAIAIGEAARAHALLGGKPNAGFDDVRAVAVPAIAHRLVLDYRARLDGLSASDLVRSLLEEVSELEEEPPGGLDGR
jgi:MoxR-like ATPase